MDVPNPDLRLSPESPQSTITLQLPQSSDEKRDAVSIPCKDIVEAWNHVNWSSHPDLYASMVFLLTSNCSTEVLSPSLRPSAPVCTYQTSRALLLLAEHVLECPERGANRVKERRWTISSYIYRSGSAKQDITLATLATIAV